MVRPLGLLPTSLAELTILQFSWLPPYDERFNVILIKELFKFSPNKFGLGWLVFVTALLSGCGSGGGSAESKTGALTPSSIAITPATATVAKGQVTHFTATATYTDGSTADITNKATWTSANSAVGSIDGASGTALGVAVGRTTVTATLQGVTSPAVSMSITTAVITAINITPAIQTTPLGRPITYTAMATYSDGSPVGNISGMVTWKTSKPVVATLSGSGIASSLTQGATIITASTTVGTSVVSSNSASLTVTSPVLATLTISPTFSNITVSGMKQYIASGVLTDGTPANLGTLTWSTSNSVVATISSTGMAKGWEAGSCTVTANTDNITSAPSALNVNSGHLMGGAIQGNNLTLETVVSSLAGSGSYGTADGIGVAATFAGPWGITTDGANLYVVDSMYNKIRKIEVATGVVTTMAGSGATGSTDGIGAAASFSTPYGITSDGVNLYVADSYNNKIRKIVIASGVVTTLAGSGYFGSVDGTGTAASFYYPNGIATDGINLYVGDSWNNKIRKIVIASGVVTTIAGMGTSGAVDGTGTGASFYYPNGITTDGINLYVADTGNHKIRKIVIANGVVTTVAGTGTTGAVDGIGTLASFNGPYGITTDGVYLYISDTRNHKIRKIMIASGEVTTVAGTGVTGADDAIGTAASFSFPIGIVTDGSNLFVADNYNRKIRQIQ